MADETLTDAPPPPSAEATKDDPAAAKPPKDPVEGQVEGAEPGEGASTDGDADAIFEPGDIPVRVVIAIAMPTLAAAVMVGGIFTGISTRIYAAIAGLMGIGIGILASRVRRPVAAYMILLGLMIMVGPLMILPDVGQMANVADLVQEARSQTSVFTPPVEFLPGWKAVQGWVMAVVGFAATWTGLVLGWRSIALLVPLPLVAFAAISVPEDAQIVSGLVCLVLFAASLGLLSSENAVDEDDEERPSLAFELRKMAKAVPVVALLIVALVFGQKYLGFLFPDPVYDPAEEPQKPKVQPLNEVQQRVLFTVESELTGPWRTGSLDVYLEDEWRLPAFNDQSVADISKEGLVDFELSPEIEAIITVKGLSGAVLPGLPNTVGLTFTGADLGYDTRSGIIRLQSGQVKSGFSYTVFGAGFPSVKELRDIELVEIPEEIEEMRQLPDPPPTVRALIEEAQAEAGDSLFDQFQYLRNFILEEVTATGTGLPIPVPPERVGEMVSGAKATPFEIVAAQAMMARWIGLPSRIGYGFDGGDKTDDGKLEVFPRHGAAFPEVFFPGYKWIPFIGTPKKAEPTVGSDPSLQNQQSGIQPSNELSVPLFLPLILEPASVIREQVALTTGILLAVALVLYLIYASYPAWRKLRMRSKKRELALDMGVHTRIALAYTEWRDYATDLGYLYPTDTPLSFQDRFIEDEEHAELAWITTRVLWGDLREDPPTEYAVIAEELSRSLRRRLGATQPMSSRMVGAISRLSLRNPYGPEVVPLEARTRRLRPGRPKSESRNGHDVEASADRADKKKEEADAQVAV